MKNENGLDRVLRFMVAIILVALGFYVTGILSVVAYILVIVMFVTAVSGFCPLYKVFGINTNKKY